MKRIIIFLISIYQSISRLFPPVCRFYPSCSQYTKEAVAKYGVVKGAFLGAKRICRCHPFNPGGYEPLQ